MHITKLLKIRITCFLSILHGAVAKDYYPFMAWMGSCGGSLIHPQWILTAAHCATNFKNKPKPIYLGSNIRETGWKTTHLKVFIHPKFFHDKRRDRVLNDIALVKLKEPVPETYGTPIKYARNKALTAYNRFDATMIGWGYTDPTFMDASDMLYEGKIVMGNNLPYPFCNFPGKLCSVVSPRVGIRMTPGDSGGPLFFKVNDEHILIGIITVLWFHPKHAFISEFTDVAFYASWIDYVIENYT